MVEFRQKVRGLKKNRNNCGGKKDDIMRIFIFN